MINILGFTATCISILFWIHISIMYAQKMVPADYWACIGVVSTFLSIGWFIYG